MLNSVINNRFHFWSGQLLKNCRPLIQGQLYSFALLVRDGWGRVGIQTCPSFKMFCDSTTLIYSFWEFLPSKALLVLIVQLYILHTFCSVRNLFRTLTYCIFYIKYILAMFVAQTTTLASLQCHFICVPRAMGKSSNCPIEKKRRKKETVELWQESFPTVQPWPYLLLFISLSACCEGFRQ